MLQPKLQLPFEKSVQKNRVIIFLQVGALGGMAEASPVVSNATLPVTILFSKSGSTDYIFLEACKSLK